MKKTIKNEETVTAIKVEWSVEEACIHKIISDLTEILGDNLDEYLTDEQREKHHTGYLIAEIHIKQETEEKQWLN